VVAVVVHGLDISAVRMRTACREMPLGDGLRLGRMEALEGEKNKKL